jgi:hypothetical protein
MGARWILFSAALLSGCFSTPTPATSGVEGQVLVGPMCPVVREGDTCPDQPYQAALTLLRPDGQEIVRFKTDEQGRFRVPLAPGDYILRPESPKTLPFASEQPVTVLPGQFTRILVTYDSGIR